MAFTKPSHPPTTVTSTATNHPIYTTLLAKAFLTDPVFRFMLNHVPWYHNAAATYHIIRLQNVAAAHKSRSIFYSASTSPDTASVEQNPECAAVVLKPAKAGIMDMNPWGWIKMMGAGFYKVFWYAGLTPWKAYFDAYVTPVERAKAAIFNKGETYYYVLFVATDEQHRGKGLAQSFFKELQQRAQEDMKPIWLESSSPASRKVYAKCGFVDVGLDGKNEEEMRLGVGEVDELGEKASGKSAVGVPVYPMVWWPEGYVKSKGN